MKKPIAKEFDKSIIKGMLHIPGVNDEAFNKWLASRKPANTSNNLWYQLS
jgi:hypothetical protein